MTKQRQSRRSGHQRHESTPRPARAHGSPSWHDMGADANDGLAQQAFQIAIGVNMKKNWFKARGTAVYPISLEGYLWIIGWLSTVSLLGWLYNLLGTGEVLFGIGIFLVTSIHVLVIWKKTHRE